MNAFSAALDTLYADTNFGVDATYVGPLGGAAIMCRVIMVAPDETWGAGLQVSAPGRQGEIRASEIATVEEGGTVTIAGHAYTVRGPKNPDDQRLIWRFGMLEA
jgi:hypothetical protein